VCEPRIIEEQVYVIERDFYYDGVVNGTTIVDYVCAKVDPTNIIAGQISAPTNYSGMVSGFQTPYGTFALTIHTDPKVTGDFSAEIYTYQDYFNPNFFQGYWYNNEGIGDISLTIGDASDYYQQGCQYQFGSQ